MTSENPVVHDLSDSDSDCGEPETTKAIAPAVTGAKRSRNNASEWKEVTAGDAADVRVTCNHCNERIVGVKWKKKVETLRKHLYRCLAYQKNRNTAQTNTLTKKFLLPGLTAAEQSSFDEALALYFLQTGTPFSRIDDPALWQALKLLRPDVQPISRRQLGGRLLDAAVVKIQATVDARLKQGGDFGCLTSDGWSTIDGKPIINYCLVTPKDTLFVEGVYTKTESHNHQFIADDISRVIDVQAKKVCIVGCVTDNTSANQKAWKVLQNRYKDKHFFGCVCHALHLLVKDLVENINWLSTLEADAKNIVKFFKNSGLNKAELTQMQQTLERKVQTLHLPGATRWGSLLKCFESVLACYPDMHAVVNAPTFLSRENKRRQELLAVFSKKTLQFQLQIAISILKPICVQIVMFQDDRKPISDVYDMFHKLDQQFAAMPSIEEEDRATLRRLLLSRWNFIYSDAHGLSYLLDPRYVGEHMDAAIAHSCNKFIEDQLPEVAVHGELFKFRSYAEFWENNYPCQVKALDDQNMSPLQWWSGLPKNIEFPRLRLYAMKLFTLCASSAASERNFSSFSFIHNKLRNRLTDDKVLNAVFVYANSKNLREQDTEEEELL